MMEVLVIIAVLTVLVGVLVPVLAKAKKRSARIGCVNYLKQVGLAYRIWAGDNGDLLPMRVPVARGGAMELAATGNVTIIFQVMSNELSTPKTLVCPNDLAHLAATNFTSLGATNISYFAGLDAKESDPLAPLAGDDNLFVNGVQVPPGILNLWSNSASWSNNRHQYFGNVTLADGSVQAATRIGFNSSAGTLFTTNRLAIP